MKSVVFILKVDEFVSEFIEDFFAQESSDKSIPYSKYLNKALELGLTESEANQVLIVLSKSGKVIYFEDNLELKGTIFLHPKNLTSITESNLNLTDLKSTIEDKRNLLEKLRHELIHLQNKHDRLHRLAGRRVKLISWAILGILTGQAILFARLVWWDYDWGIMEPVTWFTSVWEMTIGGYVYYLLTKSEYGNKQTAEMLSEKRVRKLCESEGLDPKILKDLKNQIDQLEAEIGFSNWKSIKY